MGGSDRQLDPHKVVDDVDYIINCQLKNSTNKKVDRRMAGGWIQACCWHSTLQYFSPQFPVHSTI